MSRSRIAPWTAALLIVVGALCLLSRKAGAQSLEDIFKSVLDQAIHAPIPTVIAPLVTAAENADSIAIAALEIAAGKRDREIKLEYLSASRQRQRELDRQEKAVEAIKSTLTRIKNRRAAEERKAKEDGSDPFHARFTAGGPVTLPGSYLFTLLDDGLSDIPGDDPPGPIVALVTPGFAGYTEHLVKVLDGSMGVTFSSTPNPDEFDVAVTSFSLVVASFEVAPGTPTGLNVGSLNPFGSPPAGTYNTVTGQFDLWFEGFYTNDLYGPDAPMMFFVQAFGGLVEGLGEAIVGADDPMIVPMPPGVAPLGVPQLMGAHVMDYDGATGTLRFLENTTLAPDPDVAMARLSDGSYIIDPGLDEAIGATMVIAPMTYAGSGGGVHHFSDAALSLMVGPDTVLSGTLRNVALDPVVGSFFADLDIASVAGPSAVIGEIAGAPGPKTIQLATGPGVYDLVVLTSGFATSGRLPWPDVFHLGAVPPEIFCKTGDVNEGAGDVRDVLFLNGSPGDHERTVWVQEGSPLWGTMLPPPAGGNGKFVVHADIGIPAAGTVTPLPATIGTFCFPIFVPPFGSASPVAVWNNIGKTDRVGTSMYFDGSPIPDPGRAPVIFLYLSDGDPVNLPAGTTLTFQGVVVDPGSTSPKGASVTNGAVLIVR